MKNKVVFPHGFGFIFLFCIIFLFWCFSIFAVICFFVVDGEYYQNWVVLIIGFIGFCICDFEFYQLFIQAPVKFVNNQFMTKGKNPKYFPPINKDCTDFVSYELTYKLMAQCIVFTFKDGKKINFHTMQFTKKQNLQILQEIQNRGGLQDQEIKLDNYYFNTKLKIKKNK